MAFDITNAKTVPSWKPDWSPKDRQQNYNAIVELIGSMLPLTPEAVSLTFDPATKKAKVECAIYPGTLTYQWKYGASADAISTSIDDATSTEVTLSSTQSEKYLGVEVTNTLNGTTNKKLIVYGKLPAIS